MQDYTSMRQMIVDIVKSCITLPTIEEGVIKSVSPLKLGLTNDNKMTLTDTDVIVPAHFNGKLQNGEKLHLLVVNNGKQYYILDKV